MAEWTREEFLGDVLMQALAYASYWSTSLETEVGVWVLVEDEDGAEYWPTTDTINAGFVRLLTEDYDNVRFSGYEDLRPIALAYETHGKGGDYDAEVCDVVLQLGLFGEVVYG